MKLEQALENTLDGLPEAEKVKARRFRPVIETNIGEIACHPDLGDYLGSIGKVMNEVEHGVQYRYFMLRIFQGEIFAIARGTRTLSFRVGDKWTGQARNPDEDDKLLGPGWRVFDPWNPDTDAKLLFEYLCSVAAHAKKFTEGR